MNKEFYQKEYGKRVSKFLIYYNLTEGDLAKLIDSNSTNIRSIINGEVGLNINKMINIASVFGLTYYDFANPKFKLPSKSSLPELTIKIIKERQKKGSIIRDKSNILAVELDRLINEGILNKPITSKILLSLMNSDAQKKSSTSITNLLRKEPRNTLIIQLKQKYGNESIFIEKKYAEKYTNMSTEKLKLLLDSK
ncbi:MULTISPECIES: helix-turn-helix transcriptional regulator [unclassified Empedobacter]|uniref:helix-turn-helix domain-containing protein n=1 Tax=Empedobacter TaxID=59734 RepID=UPI0025781FAF|nr:MULTISPECIES: helix-turn-helix transcriptional regulator [unclassified Empedobacter]MDM1140052.1 hypothetical protein [Empedobacter sp. R132-2]